MFYLSSYIENNSLGNATLKTKCQLPAMGTLLSLLVEEVALCNWYWLQSVQSSFFIETIQWPIERHTGGTAGTPTCWSEEEPSRVSWNNWFKRWLWKSGQVSIDWWQKMRNVMFRVPTMDTTTYLRLVVTGIIYELVSRLPGKWPATRR